MAVVSLDSEKDLEIGTEKRNENEKGTSTEKRVLFVGIGGTGKEIVSLVKARHEALAEKDRVKVGFLVVDVDAGPCRYPELENILSPNEVCHPAKGHVPSRVQKAILQHVEAQDEMAWVGERVPPGEMILDYDDFTTGTERYRQAGLLAYIWEENGGGVSSALRAAIERVTQGAHKSLSLQVFIVCSVCGGTGSGMLIDTAYLTRSLGQDHAGASLNVSAVLVLPGVFRNKVDPKTYNDLQRNATAVLTELDFYMYPKATRGARTCNPNDVSWSLRLDTEPSIFQSVFLIDNKRNNGGTIGGTETIFPAVADLLLHFSGSLSDKFVEALNNAKGTVRRNKFEGPEEAGGRDETPHYSSLGLARVVLPVRRMAVEAATDLSKWVLDKLRGLSSETPADAVVQGLVDDSLRLKLEVMARDLGLAKDAFGLVLAKAIDLRNPGQRQSKIGAVSERVGEFVRQKMLPDGLRRYCLEAIGKARDVVRLTQEETNRLMTSRVTSIAAVVEEVLSRHAEQAREADKGLVWLSQLANRASGVVDRYLVQARQGSARDRADALTRTEQEFKKSEDRLGGCAPGAVRQSAILAARKCDDWIGQKLDFMLAQAQVRILEGCLSRLKRLAGAISSLNAFLEQTLPAEAGQAVAFLRRKCEEDAPTTDTEIEADGREQLAKKEEVRESIADDCLKHLKLVIKDGNVQVAYGKNSAPTLGTSAQPFDTAREWVEHLTTCLEPHFRSHRLDDYIPTDDSASRYADACLRDAEAFVQYNTTAQKSLAGEPISITLAVAPANSRLHAAFDRADQFKKTLVTHRDETSAIVFKADIGILGRVLQFRKDAAPLEASMVRTPGLWTLGQVSHNVFWYDKERWSNLRLFFLGLAASRIVREETLSRLQTEGGAQFEYRLNIGRGQEVKVGRNLQDAILGFLDPNYDAYRKNLWVYLGDKAIWNSTKEALPQVRDEFLVLIERPNEVPTKAFRAVLKSRLGSLLEAGYSVEGHEARKTNTSAG